MKRENLSLMELALSCLQGEELACPQANGRMKCLKKACEQVAAHLSPWLDNAWGCIYI